MSEPNITGSKKKLTHRGVAAQAAILFLLLFLAGSAAALTEWLCYISARQEYSRLDAMYVETKAEPSILTEPEPEPEPELEPEPEPEPAPSSSADSASSRTASPEPAAGGRPSFPSQIVQIDFPALQAINPDCAAWIEIPGTRISYPVVFRDGDGGFYLTHTFEQACAKAGAIHIDGASDSLNSRNLLIYGHTLLDGSMFTDLHRYKSQSFFREHPYIYLHLPDGSTRQYQIAACVLTEGEQERFYLWDFKNDESAQAYYDQFMEQSLYPTDISPTAGSGRQTLVLSTCTRRIYRRLIFAIEK